MPIALNPTENVYVVATAADLPDELSRFVLYNLLYDPGAGVGMYYTSDGTNLLRLDAPDGAETDPVFTASPAGGILAGDITNWNTAYGWGDHASAGYAVKASNETITGLWNFQDAGTGKFTAYDITVGDTADYGVIQVGSAILGRVSHTAADGAPTYNLNGTFIFENPAGPVTGDIEFAFLDSTGLVRFALPKSGVGNATYNPRSMIIAGPAVADADEVTLAYWQSQGLFDNLVMDTAGSGADVGIQNDLEVEGSIYVDSLAASTTGSSISVGSDLTINGNITFTQSADGIRGYQATGNNSIDIDAVVGDGTSNSTIRFNRETNTTGTAGFILYLGNGTTSQCVNALYDNTAGNGEFSVRNGMNLWVRDGADFIISDSTDADTATFSHDGTHFNLAFSGTTDWNITGLSALIAGNYEFDVNQTVGAGQDGYVLTYDNAAGQISLASPSGTSGPVTKYKTAIESVTTSTTLQDDNHLTGWSLEAGAVYKITAHLHTTQSDAAGDPKLNWTFTNAPQDESYHYDSSNGGADFSTGGDVVLGRTVTTEVGTTMSGYFQANATTGGTLKLRWAQDSSAGITSILPGSWVTIEKIN